MSIDLLSESLLTLSVAKLSDNRRSDLKRRSTRATGIERHTAISERSVPMMRCESSCPLFHFTKSKNSVCFPYNVNIRDGRRSFVTRSAESRSGFEMTLNQLNAIDSEVVLEEPFCDHQQLVMGLMPDTALIRQPTSNVVLIPGLRRELRAGP